MRIVDFHNHYYPPEYVNALTTSQSAVRVTYDDDGNPCVHYPGDYNILVPGHRDIDYREQVLIEHGVDTQVLTFTTPGVHVESPAQETFTLGQFFAVWGVPLSADCIGSLCAKGDKQLKAWVNGEPVSGDPTRIVLEDHQQIVLAYGTPAATPVPASMVPAVTAAKQRDFFMSNSFGSN